jgi:hypothetical protein
MKPLMTAADIHQTLTLALRVGDWKQAAQARHSWRQRLVTELRRSGLSPEHRVLQEEQERLSLFSVAATCATQSSMDWLSTRMPEAVPQGDNALKMLTAALEGEFEDKLGKVATWLVQHTDVAERLTPREMNILMHQTARSPQCAPEAVTWLTNPPTGVPSWQDDPDRPLLTWVVAHAVSGYPTVARTAASLQREAERLTLLTRNMEVLLQAGIKPVVRKTRKHDSVGASPLHHLVQAYGQEVTRCQQEKCSLLPEWPQTMLVLWPALVRAGDDPRQRLTPGGPTLMGHLEKTMPTALWNQLAAVNLAIERERTASALVPQPRRSRQRC